MSGAQDQHYTDVAEAFGPALQRLAAAVEANAERRRDLLQDIHVALWRSFATFDERCSVRTWVYRVAHNVAATHVDKERRANRAHVTLDEIAELPDERAVSAEAEENEKLARLYALIRRLKAPDQQVVTLYLEDLDATAIAEITGLSAGAIATRISRAKRELARLFSETADV